MGREPELGGSLRSGAGRALPGASGVRPTRPAEGPVRSGTGALGLVGLVRGGVGWVGFDGRVLGSGVRGAGVGKRGRVLDGAGAGVGDGVRSRDGGVELESGRPLGGVREGGGVLGRVDGGGVTGAGALGRVGALRSRSVGRLGDGVVGCGLGGVTGAGVGLGRVGVGVGRDGAGLGLGRVGTGLGIGLGREGAGVGRDGAGVGEGREGAGEGAGRDGAGAGLGEGRLGAGDGEGREGAGLGDGLGAGRPDPPEPWDGRPGRSRSWAKASLGSAHSSDSARTSGRKRRGSMVVFLGVGGRPGARGGGRASGQELCPKLRVQIECLGLRRAPKAHGAPSGSRAVLSRGHAPAPRGRAPRGSPAAADRGARGRVGMFSDMREATGRPSRTHMEKSAA